MDLIANLALGFETALTPTNVLYCFVGVFLGTLVVATALGGQYGGLDALTAPTTPPTLPDATSLIAGTLALLGLVVALLSGVEPGGYSDAVGGTVGAMVFLYACIIAALSFLTKRYPTETSRAAASPADD